MEGLKLAVRWRYSQNLRGPLLALALFVVSGALNAGPPFLTDDPEPTETGHWEIYGPLIEWEGRGGDLSGSAGFEFNYGAAPDLQITAGLPIAIAHDGSVWQSGKGDVSLAAKYRLIDDTASGFQLAVFPEMSLPTASQGLGAGKVTAFLPIWFQKDSGPWSITGGGGYAINPGPGNRNYWTGGMGLSRSLGDRFLIGVEADRQGSDALGSGGSTSLGIGGTYRIGERWSLLASGGPVFVDGVPGAGYHAFFALGLDL